MRRLDLSTPAARIAAGGLALLLLPVILASGASAQADPLVDSSLSIVLICERPYLQPRYMGSDVSTCEVQDLSRDALVVPGQAGATGAVPHQIAISWEPLLNESNATLGWDITLSNTIVYAFGGQRVPFTIEVETTPQLATPIFRFVVHADYARPDGRVTRQSVNFTAEVEYYDIAFVSMDSSTITQRVGQDEIARFRVIVQNNGVYPDTYRFSVIAPPDMYVSVPATLYVAPGETGSTTVDVRTPHEKLWELGRSTSVIVKVSSIGFGGMPGTGVYSTVGVLNVRGPYLPTYWIPLLLVGLVSATIVARGSREKAQLRTMERGRPRRVELTPRQAILLDELRRTDPGTYKEKKGSLDSVYKERRADYREHRKERLAADRAEARQARAEFLAAKKDRKRQRAEEKRALKRQRAEEKRGAKLARKEEKKEAKLLKKKEKVLAKKRAALDKERAKAEKREAKLAAQQAKADRIAAKKAAREAKKKQ